MHSLEREGVAQSKLGSALEETMQQAFNMVDKVRSPPSRGLPPRPDLEDGEDISLTTGKQVPQRRGAWLALTCCLVLVAAAVGAVVGALAAHWNAERMDQFVSLIPFVSLPNAPLNFLAVGDWGRDGTYNQSLNARAMGLVASQLQADFVVSTGDNFYLHGLHSAADPQFLTSFTRIYDHPSLDKQWLAVLGNHDYQLDPNSELDVNLKVRDWRWHCEKNYRRRFKACPKYKQTNGGYCQYTVEMFFVDTSPMLTEYWDPAGHEPLNFTSMGDQNLARNYILNFLKDGLESSDATWKIVVGHHPVYSTGEHGSISDMENYFVEIFKRYQVDLYLNGHDHNLELVKVPDLETYFVTTGAGSQTRTERLGQIPGDSLFYYDLQGFVSVSVLGPTLDLRFYDAFANVVHNATLEKQ